MLFGIHLENPAEQKVQWSALLQKTYIISFLIKSKVMNNRFVPQYDVENNHEPNISRGY
jgi:hypothetical protein